MFKLAGGAISWSSKKLAGTATSSSVAEYKALSEGAKEASWLRQLVEELGEASGPIMMFCDNEAAVKLANKRSKLNKSIKHLRVAWHHVKQAIADGEVQVLGVRTGQQDADMLTKSLDGPKFKSNRERVGLRPAAGQRMGLGALVQGILSG